MLLHVLILIGFVLPACLVAAYYVSLAIARLCGASSYCLPLQSCSRSFVVLIPAHNEEATIRRSIESCQQLEYPIQQFQVVVIADNCTDATAEVARQLGVSCLERTDPDRHGKGHALRWAFDQLSSGSHDAIVVIDSDCSVDREALRALDSCIAEGSLVVQLNHVVANPDAGSLCYAARVGQYLEYDFGYAPKSAFGLWVPLVGTGMAFHRNVLEQFPWASSSVSEDIEYSLLLVRHGINARFVANAAVRHEAESNLQHLVVQRRRWARGTMHFGKRRALGFLVSGLLHGRLLIADAGWTLLTMSKPLILVHLVLALILSGVLALHYRDQLAWSLVGLSIAAAVAQAAYYSLGVLSLGLTKARLLLLLSAPLVTVRLAWITFRSLFNSSAPRWDRTPRTGKCAGGREEVGRAC